MGHAHVISRLEFESVAPAVLYSSVCDSCHGICLYVEFPCHVTIITSAFYHPSQHVDGLLAASEAGAKSGISKDEMLDYGLCLETGTP